MVRKAKFILEIFHVTTDAKEEESVFGMVSSQDGLVFFASKAASQCFSMWPSFGVLVLVQRVEVLNYPIPNCVPCATLAFGGRPFRPTCQNDIGFTNVANLEKATHADSD